LETSELKYNDGVPPSIPRDFIIFKEFNNDILLIVR
jgi:hypothetical protein